jgi:hypothetical protein
LISRRQLLSSSLPSWKIDRGNILLSVTACISLSLVMCVCVCVCVCVCLFQERGWHLRSLIRTRANRKHDHFALSILNTGAAEENGRFFHLLVFWYYLLALENKYAQYALENKYTCMKALKKQSSHTLFPENSYSPLDIMSDSPVIAISEIWRLLSLWYPARVHTSHRFRYT